MKPPVVTNDTPSADIELDDTAEAPFIDVKAYGDTSQTTYTGKNLADAFGGTWVKSNAENELIDGVYKMTANSGIIARVALQLGGLVEGETYTLSFYSRGVTVASNAGWTYARVREGQGSGEWISDRSVIAVSDDYVKHTVTFTANSVSDPWVWFYVAADNRNTNNIEIYIKDIQLEAGSTATSFEPYVGGIPAPNPDYPQNVNVVTGRQVVGVRGKNLWGGFPNGFSRTNAGVTFTYNTDGTAVVDGTSNQAAALSINNTLAESNNIYVTIDAGTYTISSSNNSLIDCFDLAGNLLASPRTSRPTFTVNETTSVYIRYRVNLGVTVDNEKVYVQLEKGEVATTYEPYQPQSYEINLGKNLFTFGYGSGEFQGITWTRNGDTAVGVGTATGNYTDTGTKIDLPAPLKAGQDYVFSIPAPVSFGCSLYLFDKNGQVISPSARINAGETSVVFNKEVDIYQARITLSDYGGAGKELDIELRAQIELGSTATGYAPQFEPIELCKIGDYQDYIYRDEDGDWYVHKACGKFVFDGTENWQSNPNYTSTFNISRPSTIKTGETNMLSNQVSKFETSLARITDYGIVIGGSLNVKNINITNGDVTEFKSWLNSSNLIIYYPLITPTDTQITNSELISQLDALMEGGSYDGKTYIKVTATDPNLPGLLYVEAGKYD
jgi:hypothetical protein